MGNVIISLRASLACRSPPTSDHNKGGCTLVTGTLLPIDRRSFRPSLKALFNASIHILSLAWLVASILMKPLAPFANVINSPNVKP